MDLWTICKLLSAICSSFFHFGSHSSTPPPQTKCVLVAQYYQKYIVDGTGDYDGFSDACAGLEFSGTLTNVKNKKVYNFSFSYKHNGGHGAEECEDLEWKGDFEEDDFEAIANEVVGAYNFAFCE